MKCPKCNGHVRLKMTGAICLKDKCNWSTDDRTKLAIKEVNTSKIASRFQEDMIDTLPSMDDYLD